MYSIYWIHMSEHSDPFTEGYIGLSNQPEKRLRAHTTDAALVGSKYVRKYVEEYGTENIQHKILHSGLPLEEAKQYEFAYRPTPRIGWNIQKGGGSTPNCSGRTHTSETKTKIAESNTRTKSTRTYTSHFKGMTTRHSDEMKQHLGSFHKGKTISEEHKRAITEKNSGINNPKSKSITLYDHVLQLKTTYVNLREAASMLGINYSTIRSAVQRGHKIVYKRWEIMEVKGEE